MAGLQLQLALDFVSLHDALTVAGRAAAHVDLIEAGTPLMKACGLDPVRRLKRLFPDKLIVADMKTMDTGRLEAEMAFRAGADAMTVLGAAARETIAGAVQAARAFKGEVVVDTIGVDDIDSLVFKIEGLQVDWLIVHAGIDQQQAGVSPFTILDGLHERTIRPRMCLVGGIDAQAIPKLHDYSKVERVVVGGAITKAKDPREAAASIRRALDRLANNRQA